MGGAFCTPLLGPLQGSPYPKKLVGCNFGNPILSPSGSLALFCSFGLLSISGALGPPSLLPIPNFAPSNPPTLGKTYTELVL